MKKIIIFILLFVALVGLVFWFFFWRGGEGERERGFGFSLPFFPSRDSGNNLPNPDENFPPEDNLPIDNPNIKKFLRKISDLPTSGVDFLISTTTSTSTSSAGRTITTFSTSTEIYFVEKTTGQVHKAKEDGLGIVRAHRVDIPRVQEVLFFGRAKNQILYRYLNEARQTVENYAFVLEGESPATGNFLSEEIYSLAVDPNKKTLYALEKTGNLGGRVVEINLANNLSVKEIAKLPFGQGFLTIGRSGSLYFNNSSSAGVTSTFYKISNAGKTLQKILSGPGLTTLLSPDEKNLLWSEGDGQNISFGFYNLATKEKTILPQNTLTEKCVFAPKEAVVYCGVPKSIVFDSYPDGWYQGITRFSDVWLAFDLKTSAVAQITQENHQDIDVLNPKINSAGTAIVFIDKGTITPWLLTLPPPAELWQAEVLEP